MPTLHLIKKSEPGLPPINPVKGEDGLWTSGYWKLSQERAARLVGGKVAFHRKQIEPSFFGGVVEKTQLIEEREFEGRYLLIFRFDAALRGVRTSREGFSMEMKWVEP